MNNTCLHIGLVFLLLLSACKKEILVFDSPASKQLELPLLLNFNDKACALDIETKSFWFPIAQNSISNFTVKIDFQEYSSVKFNGISLDNGVLNQLGTIAVNTAYELEFTTEGEFNVFTLYFTNIPTVQIVALDQIKNEPKSYARILVNYSNANMPTFNSIVGIENRGISSLAHPKKSMGFKLLQSFDMKNEYSASLFNKTKNTEWVLDAMYSDKAQGRNKTSLELWQSFPQNIDHLGTSCEYVEVFLNYESLGLYTFCEKLSYEFLELNAESILITGKQNLATTYFREVPSSSPSGPYWAGWEQKSPKFGNNWTALEKLSKLTVTASDQAFIQQIETLIDLDNFIDYFLFVNSIKASDDIAKNWFLMKKNDSEPFVIVPWDLDVSWGVDFKTQKVDENGVIKNGIYERLLALNPNNFREKLKARWQELKYKELSTSTLTDIFKKNFDILNRSNIIERNNQKWDRTINLSSEETYINSWIVARWYFVDEYIGAL